MRKIYVLLIFCLLILSVFISCDDKSQGVELVIITLDSGILKEEVKTIETAENQSVILPSGDNLWSTSGYTFSGWAETATGIDKYKAGDKYSSSKSITLYATWTPNPKITYDSNNGTGETITEYHKSGDKVTIKETSFTKDGCTLSRWSTSQSAKNDTYTIGQEITLTKDLTLYAVWVENENKATITYSSNGGNGTINSVPFAKGTEVKLDKGTALSRDGFKLSSWNTSSDGEGTKYELGSTHTFNEDVTLYAVWTENYNIKYYSYNEGDGKYKLIAIDYPQETSATIGDGNGLFRQGAELYWTTKPDDTGIPYDVGEKYTGAEDLSLYAKWQENDGKLTYTLYMDNDDNKSYSVKASKNTISGEIEILGKYKKREVTAIAESAFEGCSSLTGVTIPSTVTSIGNKAFSGCTKLESVDLGENESLTTIGSEAFKNCRALTSFDIPNSVTSIGESAFKTTEIETIEIPTGVTAICDNTFSECYKLKNVYIPNTVESIGSGAFMYCYSLEEISIPSSVSEIASNAFSVCHRLEKIYIDNIEGADGAPTGANWGAYYDYATVYWTGNYKIIDNEILTVKDKSLIKGSILLPDKVNGKEVKSINEGAFSGCTELTDISIPSLVTSIGGDAFSGCTSLKSIYIDNIEGTTSAPTGAPWGTTNSPTVYWTGNYSVYLSMGVGLTVKDKSLIKGSIVLPDKVNGKVVTSIGYKAFADCSNLTSISIPSTVKSIGSYAFQNCTGLREITIPKNVTYIGENAFVGCNNISVRIQNISLEYYSSWNSAFSGCELIYLIIDAGIESIGTQFQGCGNPLKSISIPSTITSIASNAFSNCSGLTSIYIDKEYDSSLDSDNNGWGAPNTCTIKWKDNKVSYGFAISSVGDIMELGKYPSTAGDYAGKAVTWKALSVDTTKKRALMISEKVLGNKEFGSDSSNSYVNSSIRSYLNGDFRTAYGITNDNIGNILSVDVTSSIETTTVGSGNDKFFLLSNTEAFSSDLFADNAARKATNLSGTAYSSWWLRSLRNSDYGKLEVFVNSDGVISYSTDSGEYGLRPAFWYTWE